MPTKATPSSMPTLASTRRTRLPSGVRWFMPVAKLSPISQATISITPWMPNEIATDSSGALVKFRKPSKVV